VTCCCYRSLSGPGRAVGLLCVCVYVCVFASQSMSGQTFELSELLPRYLASWFTMTLSRSG